MGSLDGRVALVSGGGRGIGRAIALALAAEGARVAIGARTASELATVAAECGNGAFAVPLDVTDEAACAAAVAAVRERCGHLDVLVNNAGVMSAQRFTELDRETWRRTLAVDLDGPFLLTRAALPGMLERHAGSVIMIGSIASRIGLARTAAYTAAKHGLLGLTRALAAEYKTSGLTFNCVCPGYTDTPRTAQTVRDLVAQTGRTPEEALRLIANPDGKLTDPADVAAVCVLLASAAGRGINGQAIGVDGGAVQG